MKPTAFIRFLPLVSLALLACGPDQASIQVVIPDEAGVEAPVPGVRLVLVPLQGNFGFELEMRPNATWTDVIVEAFMGANPIFAPATLALAGFLGLASSYYHPALAQAKP